MKFEKFIQENKKEFEFDEDLTGVWSQIEKKMVMPEKPTRSKGLIKKIFLGGIAASLLLCMIYFIGSKESDSTDPSYYSALDSKPPLAKILAIKTSDFGENHSGAIINTLIHIIKTDENNNVRLAAIRAIEKFVQDEKVKITLINLLPNEEDPYIIIAMLNILQRGNVTESLPVFDEVLEKNTQLKFVKTEALKAKEILKNI